MWSTESNLTLGYTNTPPSERTLKKQREYDSTSMAHKYHEHVEVMAYLW